MKQGIHPRLAKPHVPKVPKPKKIKAGGLKVPAMHIPRRVEEK